jgi:hypothetical protein
MAVAMQAVLAAYSSSSSSSSKGGNYRQKEASATQ